MPKTRSLPVKYGYWPAPLAWNLEHACVDRKVRKQTARPRTAADNVLLKQMSVGQPCVLQRMTLTCGREGRERAEHSALPRASTVHDKW